MPQPILRNAELEKLRQVDHGVFEARTIDITWPIDEGAAGHGAARSRRSAREASELVERGANIIILSDRNVGAERVAIPSLLAVAAVHHHLVREGTRLRIGLVIESGEPREIHHMACLIGYGAGGGQPVPDVRVAVRAPPRRPAAGGHDRRGGRAARSIKAIGKGLLKMLSKMGISTIQSYCGAQIFEAVGLEPELVDRHFTGTPSRIGGVGLGRARRARRSTATPAPTRPRRRELLPGRRRLRVAPRRRAPHLGPGDDRHAPAGRPPGRRRRRRVRALRHATSTRRPCRKASLRGLLRFATASEPVPLDEVEPADGDRQALLDRRHVAGRAVARGARDARRRA